jgi:hypothetical protein
MQGHGVMTWDEWYSQLDKLLIPCPPGQPSKLLNFFREARRCRLELPLSRNDPRARILDELWSAGVRLIYVDLIAAETHRRTAAMLQSEWRTESFRTEAQLSFDEGGPLGPVQCHRADRRSAA